MILVDKLKDPKRPATAREFYTVVQAIGETLQSAAGEIKALRGRVAELEAQVSGGLEYQGTHEAGKSYRRNVACTHNGCLWISTVETRQRPGDGHDWKLAVRAGRDAR